MLNEVKEIALFLFISVQSKSLHLLWQKEFIPTRGAGLVEPTNYNKNLQFFIQMQLDDQ